MKSFEEFLTVSGLFLLSGSVEGKQCWIIGFLDCRMTLREKVKPYKWPKTLMYCDLVIII